MGICWRYAFLHQQFWYVTKRAPALPIQMQCHLVQLFISTKQVLSAVWGDTKTSLLPSLPCSGSRIGAEIDAIENSRTILGMRGLVASSASPGSGRTETACYGKNRKACFVDQVFVWPQVLLTDAHWREEGVEMGADALGGVRYWFCYRGLTPESGEGQGLYTAPCVHRER